jgi:hypothetical protein
VPKTADPKSRARVTTAATLFGAALALVLIALTYQWGPNLGDGPNRACLERGAPEIAGPTRDNPPWRVEQSQSWMPLGVTCQWSTAGLTEPVVIGPGAGPSVLAGVGALALVGAVVLRLPHRVR